MKSDPNRPKKEVCGGAHNAIIELGLAGFVRGQIK